MNECAYSCQAAVTAYTGAPGTGKTQALIGRVARALEAGVEPGELLVFAASAAAAQTLGARIAAACGERGREVRVTTPLAFSAEVLDAPGARAFVGGRTHVLAGFEEAFFFEDMRVTGENPRRLREMLKFLQRGWSEMRDDEPGWLVNAEERAVHAFARGRLALMGGLLRAEAAAMCARYVAADPEVLAGVRCTCVFADDYRAMSRAAQRLVRMLAARELVVAWDALDGLRGEEPYGYAEGLCELEEACAAGACGAAEDGLGGTCDDAFGAGEARVCADACCAAGDGPVRAFECIELRVSAQALAPRQAVANLLAQECLAGEVVDAPEAAPGAPAGSFAVVAVADLKNEMPRLAEEVKALFDAGVPAEKVAVAAPTDAWARRAAAALERAGVAANLIEARQALGGDVRDLAKCAGSLAYTALHLAARPQSAAAWRCWCGFGDYLACSSGMGALVEQRAQTGAPLPELLAELARGVRPGEGVAQASGEPLAPSAAAQPAGSIDHAKLAARYGAACALLEAARGKTGPELLAELCAGSLGTREVPGDLADLLGTVGDDETAEELFARAERALMAPAFAPGAVRVGCWDALLGQDPDAVVLCGMANGLVPPRAYFDLAEATMGEQDKMHRRLVERLAALAGKARATLLCTTFSRAGIVEAETLKLQVERVRLLNDQRVCDLAPSVCIEYLKGTQLVRRR